MVFSGNHAIQLEKGPEIGCFQIGCKCLQLFHFSPGNAQDIESSCRSGMGKMRYF